MKHRKDIKGLVLDTAIVAVPKLLAVLMMLAGAFLLASVLSPIDPEAMPFVRQWLPLQVVELSHLAGVATGVLLIFAARGLWERLDSAWYMALGLLVAGAILSMTRELAVGVAEVMILCALILLPCKRAFNRRSRILTLTIKPGWLLITATLLLLIASAGFYFYERTPYAHELWQRFAYEASVSRFLRGLVVIALTVALFALYRLFGLAKATPDLPDDEDMEDLRGVVELAQDPQAWLALTGDKHILWNEDRTAFAMYGVSGRSWVVLSAPVGPPEEVEKLGWRLKEMAALAKAKLSVYRVTTEFLPLVIDLGLRPFKIGEEALVPVQSFDLAGKKGYGFRQVWRKFEQIDAQFEVLRPEEIETHMPRLKAISDAWLEEKGGKEKGYSLGYFDPDYMRLTPIAVIRINGEIMAFANLWAAHARTTLSLDLMRYAPDAPPNIMEYLFLRLIFHARDEGYQWFSLGMAPLSGLEARPLSPAWYKIAALVYAYGGEVYNFDGLRAYKEKFKPVWKPIYFAVSGNETALMPALLAVVQLGGRVEKAKDA
ncbi:phosphatidylglycerol lysyltransferase domain-containing protein [Asticcacaulis sp. AND118]|uniref:phosphatidylglycerol lysyltransferase domain-containing protein n=1 Tax=Asticcacaulis sp. AND118 TaxID=2840468 RepID=UPI001CFF8E45|nr:phosphatidylglycerol lysyltransferase domain-containing protein [Asticcacaulis sp. AND118]UDF05148.1 phosphatidylglycerol lysyltransferase domain-containing protein [Asticcacaulis sp. AND118]